MRLKNKRKKNTVSKPPENLTKGFALRRKPLLAGGSDQERVRLWIVNIVFVIYWLLIFEGALRKWALPSMQKIIFFIRDPFVLTVYFLAFKYKMWPRITPLFATGLTMCAGFLGLSLVQSLANNLNLIIVLYGWRNYCFYLPLAFLIGEHFRAKDLVRLVRQTLWVSIPVALLCYRQFNSPMTDIVNQTYDRTAQVMLVGRGIVRTSGTFTVSAAQTLYIGTVIAMLSSVWLLPSAQRPIKWLGLLLASAAAITMIAVSGARSAFLESAVIVLFGVAAVIVMHKYRIRWGRILALPALVIIAGVSYVCLFPTAYSVMVERQMMAQGVEGNTWHRIFGTFIAWYNTLPQLSLLGAGLGAYTNAASMITTGQMGVGAEDEWSRHLLEVGILGFVYIAYRIWLCAWLVRQAFVATRRSSNPLPLLLMGFEGLTLLIGQITLQGTINGYGWVFAGFCIAANKLGRPSKDVPAASNKLWT